MSLAFSITVSLLLDALNEGFHSEAEITGTLGVPLLGIVPKLKTKEPDFVYFDPAKKLVMPCAPSKPAIIAA